MRLFDYFDAKSVEGACSLLEKYKGEAKILSGGQSLIILMKMRLASPKQLINLKTIPNLDYIQQDRGALRIGALASYNSIANSTIVRKTFPGLSEAASVIADVQVRNAGTIGGNVCHGDPTTDLPPILTSLGASVKAVRKGGERVIPLNGFYKGPFETVLNPDEMVSEIIVANPPPKSGSCYQKFVMRHGDMAIASVGTALTLAGSRCTDVKITMGGVGPIVIRATKAESLLRGEDIVDLTEVANMAAQEAKPVTDHNATEEFRRQLIVTLTKRTITESVNRAKSMG